VYGHTSQSTVFHHPGIDFMDTSGFRAALLPGLRWGVKSPIVTMLTACTLLFGQSATIVRADQTISTAVTGAQYGDGGTFTITSAGSVTNNGGNAVTSTSGQSITTFVNDGATFAYNASLLNDATSMNAVVNSGTMSGLAGLYSTGTIGTFTNQSTGNISAYNWPIIVSGSGSGIGSLTNSGAIVNTGGGAAIIANDRSVIGTLTNTANGTIAGAYSHGLGVSDSQLGTLNNAGSITGPDRGIYASGTSASIATLTNSGTTSGSQVGITVQTGTIGSLTNLATGLIQGTGYDGLQNIAGTITTIDNSGSLNGLGRSGIQNEEYNGDAHIGTITNRTGATVSGSGYGIGNVFNNTGFTATIDLIDNAGSVSGGSQGVYSHGTLTTLTNSGSITGGNQGVEQAGGTLTTLTNSGTIQGSAYYGVYVTGGTLTSLGNSGDVLGGWVGVRNENQTIGTITNAATGTIQGTAYDGIQNVGGTITTIDNSGVVNGVGRTGIRNDEYYGNAHIGSIINRAGASLSGTDFGIGNINNYSGSTATIDSITNSGDILGNQMGVHNEGNQAIGTITNGATGTIQGTIYDGIENVGGTITSIDNSGVINGVGRSGIRNEDYLGVAHIGTITNRAGSSISGSDYGIGNFQAYGYTATIDSIDNAGSVYGTSVGVYNLTGDIPSLVNSGTINGVSAAIYNGGGSIGSLDNSGTIGNVTINFGGIASIQNTGVFGDLGNSGFIGTGSGTAISSTGGGASLGAIYNAGTINGAVTVANQDLLVHGGSSPQFGVFENGTITVQNGSLTLVDGSTYLDSDVIVSSLAGTAGQGTMTNQGELILGAARQLDGSFVQTSSGSYTAALFDPSTYGTLAVTGSATFDGVLNLEEDGLALASGQTFNLFLFSSSVGGFASLAVNGVALTSLGGGSWAYGSLILTEVLSGSGLSMSVTAAAVPEIDPASFGAAAALLLGSLSLLERRRRGVKATVAG